MGFSTTDQDLFERIEQAIVQIGWLGQRQFTQLLAEQRFDLTVSQFHVLLHLSYSQEECKMSDLARLTHQSAATLTGVIDRLIEKQLVARGRTEEDRRQVMVSITERGGLLLQAIKRARRDEVQAALAHMRPAEVAELLRLLDAMLEGMLRAIQIGERAVATEQL